ncbi:MAG TPA: hypothetical protein RMF84_21210 [Polyangiaceae bacterium LLY-WYZ-14_1]|nr:hypothetical protein [Polyangiaceae bacterium LLY-WYZ-14_1]
MTRGQRLVHLRVWAVLGPVLIAAVIYAIATRGMPAQAPPPGSAAAATANATGTGDGGR